MSNSPLLDVQHLNAWYGAAQVVFDAHLHVDHGEVVALIGRNGAGKSSLVNLIPRFYDVAEGRVLVNGTDVRDLDQETLRRDRKSVV